LSQPIAQQPFCLGVDHRYRIGRSALRPHRATAGAARVSSEHLGAAMSLEPGGLGGQRFGN
jgi:hypothetical protein